MNERNRVAEFVLPGHPDKLCDAIADRIVEEAARREKRALCGLEVAVHRDQVFITGRVACRQARRIRIKEIVRQIYRSAGYGDDWRPDPGDIRVKTDLCLQELNPGEDHHRIYADDQSIVTGYAVKNPGTNFLPMEHWVACRLTRKLDRLRQERPDLLLGPDGKLIVCLKETPEGSRLDAVSVSVQQSLEGSQIELHRAFLELLKKELPSLAGRTPGLSGEVPERFNVNGVGNFETGGPEGDNGLSGKKLVVDAYGPRVPIGGGALSGKDFFKADRAGALLARRLAKAVVLTGLAVECRATLCIFPGEEVFRIVSLCDQEGNNLDSEHWSGLLDLSLRGAGETFTGCVDLVDVARHGHFTEPERPWEKLSFQ